MPTGDSSKQAFCREKWVGSLRLRPSSSHHRFYSHTTNYARRSVKIYLRSILPFGTEEHLVSAAYVEYIYDVTVAYADAIVQSEVDLVTLGLCPKKVHFDIRRIPVRSIPHSEDDLADWLKKLWMEKEERLRKFYSQPEPSRKLDTLPGANLYEVNLAVLNGTSCAFSYPHKPNSCSWRLSRFGRCSLRPGSTSTSPIRIKDTRHSLPLPSSSERNTITEASNCCLPSNRRSFERISRRSWPTRTASFTTYFVQAKRHCTCVHL